MASRRLRVLSCCHEPQTKNHTLLHAVIRCLKRPDRNLFLFKSYYNSSVSPVSFVHSAMACIGDVQKLVGILKNGSTTQSICSQPCVLKDSGACRTETLKSSLQVWEVSSQPFFQHLQYQLQASFSLSAHLNRPLRLRRTCWHTWNKKETTALALSCLPPDSSSTLGSGSLNHLQCVVFLLTLLMTT